MLLAGVALTALAYNRLVLLKYPWTHGILDAEEDGAARSSRGCC